VALSGGQDRLKRAVVCTRFRLVRASGDVAGAQKQLGRMARGDGCRSCIGPGRKKLDGKPVNDEKRLHPPDMSGAGDFRHVRWVEQGFIRNPGKSAN
jgi:hypothetical protein